MNNEQSINPDNRISRREFLRWLLLTINNLFLVACGGGSLSNDGENNTSQVQDNEPVPDPETLSPEELVKNQADYILRCKYDNPGHVGHGAINNVETNNPGEGHDWIDPGVMSVALMGLLETYKEYGEEKHLKAVIDGCICLANMPDGEGKVKRQYKIDPNDNVDGLKPHESIGEELSPRDAAQMIMVITKLLEADVNSDDLSKEQKDKLEDSLSILGEFLVGHLFSPDDDHGAVTEERTFIKGGYDKEGNLRTDSWISDNSYAYRAFSALALKYHSSDLSRYLEYANMAVKIKNGIDKMKIEEDDKVYWATWITSEGKLEFEQEDEKDVYNWVNYAPLMLGLVENDSEKEKVANWIIGNLSKDLGNDKLAVIESTKTRGECGLNGPNYCYSPGYALQALIALLGTSRFGEVKTKVMNWLEDSGLISENGGLVDWIDSSNGETAEEWKKFIDTSAYYIMVEFGAAI